MTSKKTTKKATTKKVVKPDPVKEAGIPVAAPEEAPRVVENPQQWPRRMNKPSARRRMNQGDN